MHVSSVPCLVLRCWRPPGTPLSRTACWSRPRSRTPSWPWSGLTCRPRQLRHHQGSHHYHWAVLDRQDHHSQRHYRIRCRYCYRRWSDCPAPCCRLSRRSSLISVSCKWIHRPPPPPAQVSRSSYTAASFPVLMLNKSHLSPPLTCWGSFSLASILAGALKC